MQAPSATGMSTGAMASGTSAFEARQRALIHRIQARDGSALQALYDETSRILYSLALRILSDREDAEEVVLDVYQRVWNAADRYDSERGSVLAWLTVMTRRRAIDRIRQSNVRRNRELPVEAAADAASGDPAPEAQSILEQQRKLVRAAMGSLSPEQREAIELAFYSGMSHSEVAEALGAPLGTIKTRIRMGMQKLRKALPPVLAAAGD